jgi:hypothetical protein
MGICLSEGDNQTKVWLIPHTQATAKMGIRKDLSLEDELMSH